MWREDWQLIHGEHYPGSLDRATGSKISGSGDRTCASGRMPSREAGSTGEWGPHSPEVSVPRTCIHPSCQPRHQDRPITFLHSTKVTPLSRTSTDQEVKKQKDGRNWAWYEQLFQSVCHPGLPQPKLSELASSMRVRNCRYNDNLRVVATDADKTASTYSSQSPATASGLVFL